MNPEEWQRVRPIPESALELDSAYRTAYLDGACADGSLRREVETLIAVHEQAGTKVLEPDSAVKLKLDEEAQFCLLPGKRIGVCEIAEKPVKGPLQNTGHRSALVRNSIRLFQIIEKLQRGGWNQNSRCTTGEILFEASPFDAVCGLCFCSFKVSDYLRYGAVQGEAVS